MDSIENPTPSHTRVEKVMLEYLQYIHLVTLLQHTFERPKCEPNIFTEHKGNVPPQSPSLTTVFIQLWYRSQKPHIQDQVFYLPDGTMKDHRGTDYPPAGQPQSRHGRQRLPEFFNITTSQGLFSECTIAHAFSLFNLEDRAVSSRGVITKGTTRTLSRREDID